MSQNKAEQYRFFAVFSRIEKEFDNESDKSKIMQKSKMNLMGAVNEMGQLNPEYVTIERKDKGIGQAGSNRTFGFYVDVPRDAIKQPDKFDPQHFADGMERYIHAEEYDWTQIITENDDVVFSNPRQIINDVESRRT